MGEPMLKTYERAGVRFQYPEDWDLSVEQDVDFWRVELKGPGTAFLIMQVMEGVQDKQKMLTRALEVFQAEYGDIDSYHVQETIASRPALGHDVNFFCLDLTNTSFLRAFNTERRTFFLLAECTDTELEEVEPVFRAIMSSLTVEEQQEESSSIDWLFGGTILTDWPGTGPGRSDEEDLW
jgi:hypothetical protein